jgi:hypothetical protein
LPTRDDFGADIVRVDPDGSFTVVQGKLWSRPDAPVGGRRPKAQMEENCPTCAAEPLAGRRRRRCL